MSSTLFSIFEIRSHVHSPLPFSCSSEDSDLWLDTIFLTFTAQPAPPVQKTPYSWKSMGKLSLVQAYYKVEVWACSGNVGNLQLNQWLNNGNGLTMANNPVMSILYLCSTSCKAGVSFISKAFPFGGCSTFLRTLLEHKLVSMQLWCMTMTVSIPGSFGWNFSTCFCFCQAVDVKIGLQSFWQYWNTMDLCFCSFCQGTIQSCASL